MLNEFPGVSNNYEQQQTWDQVDDVARDVGASVTSCGSSTATGSAMLVPLSEAASCYLPGNCLYNANANHEGNNEG